MWKVQKEKKCKNQELMVRQTFCLCCFDSAKLVTKSIIVLLIQREFSFYTRTYAVNTLTVFKGELHSHQCLPRQLCYSAVKHMHMTHIMLRQGMTTTCLVYTSSLYLSCNLRYGKFKYCASQLPVQKVADKDIRCCHYECRHYMMNIFRVAGKGVKHVGTDVKNLSLK